MGYSRPVETSVWFVMLFNSHLYRMFTVYLQAFLLSMVFHLVQCPRLQSSFRLAGGTQVKWNRKDGNILASSHLDEILTWDRRVSGRTKHPTGDLIWCRKDQFRPHA